MSMTKQWTKKKNTNLNYKLKLQHELWPLVVYADQVTHSLLDVKFFILSWVHVKAWSVSVRDYNVCLHVSRPYLGNFLYLYFL